MKVKDLKLGQVLYAYNSKILEHKVIEIQTLETDRHKEKFWILECQSCNDHSSCKFATKLDDYGNLIYSHMVNQYGEEYEDSSRCKNEQYYWQNGSQYFLTRKEARLYIHEKNIAYHTKNIHELESRIESSKKCISESEEIIKGLKDKELEDLSTLNNK